MVRHTARPRTALLLIVLMLLAVELVMSIAASARLNHATASTYSPYYIDELAVSNLIEKDGITYHYAHKNIDNASCLGLRRYGVQSDQYGLDKFHRFKCDADGADNHFYTVQVSTTNGPKAGYWYSQQLSVIREF